MTILLHAANVLYLVSYLLKDILWLRIVTCVAGLLLLATFIFVPEPLWTAIAWNVVFFVINAVQIKVLLFERRPVRLRDDEQRLYQLVFRSLRPREFVRLLALGSWQDRAEGDIIVTRGKELDRIMVIFDGKAAVRVDGRTVVELGAGKFVGEMSFLTGQAPGADVAATAPTRLVTWSSGTLKTFLAHNPDLRAAIQLILGTDLVAKLRAPA